MLSLFLLGPMRIQNSGGDVRLAGSKTRALLAYLASRLDTNVPRETLVGLFWGDRGEDQASAINSNSLALRTPTSQGWAKNSTPQTPISTTGSRNSASSEAIMITQAQASIRPPALRHAQINF